MDYEKMKIKHIVCFEGKSSSVGKFYLTTMVRRLFAPNAKVMVYPLKIDSTRNLKKQFKQIVATFSWPSCENEFYCVGKSLGAFRMLKAIKDEDYVKKIISIDPTNGIRLILNIPLGISISKKIRSKTTNVYQDSTAPRGSAINGVYNRIVFGTNHKDITTHPVTKRVISDVVLFGSY